MYPFFTVLTTFLLLFNSSYSANILGVFWFPSISHQQVYQAIWKELSLKGHNVTVITTDPLNDPSLANLTEINVNFAYDYLKTHRIQDAFSKDASIFKILEKRFNFMDGIAELVFGSPQFQEFLGKDNQFDLVLLECFHPVTFALGDIYEAPTIGVSPMGAFTAGYDMIGNPNHPVLYPDILLRMHSKTLNVWQKIKSVAFSVWARIYHYAILTPRAEEMAGRFFKSRRGNREHDVGDLQYNMSLLFLNVNPFIHSPRPNVPSVVELGQMHIKPPKPLPSDLNKILDDAKEGVIYLSLGSNVKSVNLNEKLRNTIITALSELPYKVLWKWEDDTLPNQPKNVIIRKWFPQQDVLAHPNVKAFFTQGGLQSIEEAISREVPMVAMPFMCDQSMNVHKIVDLGIALSVDKATVTKEELKNAILDVIQERKYKDKIKEVRDILYDKPMTSLEKAVWWSEYVIRHKGAQHLRSPTANISWFEFLMLDVIFVVILLPTLVMYLCHVLIRKLFKRDKK